MEALSDEVILHIASFLNFRDVMSISCVNRTFNKISKDKSLCRVADFHNYRKLNAKIVMNYIESFRYSSLKIVNFEDCYWLSFTTIQHSLRKCRNLVEINLLGCSVTIKGLYSILLHNPMIKSLSWSVPEGVKEDLCHRDNQMLVENLRNCFKNLKSLTLRIDHTKDETVACLFSTEMDLLHLAVFFRDVNNTPSYIKIKSSKDFKLPCFSTLHVPGESRIKTILFATVLNIISKPVGMKEIITSFEIPDTILPQNNSHLEKLEVSGPLCLMAENANKLVYFNSSRSHAISCDDLQNICRMNANLKCLNLHGCQNCLGDDLRGLHVIASNCRNLCQLNIGKIHYHCRTNGNELLTVTGKIMTLKCLALSDCLLARTCPENLLRAKQAIPTALFGSNKRISHFASHPRFKGCSSGSSGNQDVNYPTEYNHERRVNPDCSSHLNSLSEDNCITDEKLSLCTNIEEVEIWKNDCDWVLEDKDFMAVSQWNKLRKLTISGVILMGKMDFLLLVAKHCPMLELLNLNLIDEHFSPGYACQLTNALPFFHNLQVLRLDQPYFNITRPFMSSIYECKRLHSLCIITKGGHIKDGVNFFELLIMCQNLSILLISCESPATRLKRIQKDLVEKFRPHRPSLFVAMLCHSLQSLEHFTKLPYRIKNDLVYLKCRVACAMTD